LDTKGPPLNASAHDGIWLLDDDVSMLKALGRLMNSAGFIVEKFNHPAAFLARLEHAPCRVAILDVWMPEMSGLEVQACLRRDSPDTRIIFISGRDDASAVSMKLTPSSTARRKTFLAFSRSGGQPQISSPVNRIAPNPSRLTKRSPPNKNVSSLLLVLAAATSSGNPPVKTPATPARLTSKNVLRFIAGKI
jgi:CheY-like chemotaxis protein